MNSIKLTLMKIIMVTFIALCFLSSAYSQGNDPFIKNLLDTGYYADPSIVKHNGTYYLYATIDPWGADELAVLESKDFKKWAPKRLNWPTKQLCTSATSNGNKVWAPSVVKAKNGKYYMYVSVGSEVWVGVSAHPLGPWRNAKSGGGPLIKGNLFPGYHMIDAECFIDTDGKAYLYWGSGINWVNGHCFVVKLKNDMVSFDGAIKDVTPPNFFEGPFMLKNNSTYYLMYSDGLCYDSSYKVRYSIGKTPFGPWKEGVNSPILSTTADSTIIGPGHHTVFKEKNQHYILYHKIYESNGGKLLRQLSVDSLNFDRSGFIKKVRR